MKINMHISINVKLSSTDFHNTQLQKAGLGNQTDILFMMKKVDNIPDHIALKLC